MICTLTEIEFGFHHCPVLGGPQVEPPPRQSMYLFLQSTHDLDDFIIEARDVSHIESNTQQLSTGQDSLNWHLGF